MQIIIQSKNNIIDITNNIVDSINIQSFYKKEPTKLTLYMAYIENEKISQGDIITVKMNKNLIFLGYIFTKKEGKDLINIVAYDKIRYLMTRDTINYKNITASGLIRRICQGFSLKLGEIQDTQYKIPYRIEENQHILDIIYTAIDITTKFNREKYIFYDECGKICLKNYKNMKLDVIVDYDKDMYEYNYESTIDKQTYNSVKVCVKDKKTKMINTYIKEDEKNIKKWGVLRAFKKLPNDFSKAQAENYAENMLKLMNKVNEKIKIVLAGDMFCHKNYMRAGNIINIKKGNVIKEMLIEQCIYIISNNECIVRASLGEI